MIDTVLPFKEYTVMSNNLIQNLNCSDVYRTYTLLLTADKQSLETNTTLEQLAGFVGEKLDNYKKSKGTLSFNDKLRATGEVVIHDIDSGRKDRHWTMYRFNQVEQGNYRRIGREFYDTCNTLDLKLRGFILKLFSVAEPHSHVVKLSMRKLKERIHMGHSTISQYIGQLKDLDLLDEVDGCLILKVKGLIVDQPSDKYVEKQIAIWNYLIEVYERDGIPLSRECMIYKKYKEKGFKDVKNMHALIKSLEAGTVGRKRPVKEEIPCDIIL
ncbi:hypothetical protein [Bacteroides zhangwenhongii]|uniref:hypothetical protein n=1 Tax=Bacteroides zhangwenhongii TaxID=2650157 RepID=UPI0022DEC7A0|nr:hypothetical protein [Bacteroides zhangwenhongii]